MFIFLRAHENDYMASLMPFHSKFVYFLLVLPRRSYYVAFLSMYGAFASRAALARSDDVCPT